MEELKTLFKYEIPQSKANSERATVIEFFVDNVRNKKGEKYRPAFIASKLSHLSLSDLYFMKSQATEYSKKEGGSVGRYFWGSLKKK